MGVGGGGGRGGRGGREEEGGKLHCSPTQSLRRKFPPMLAKRWKRYSSGHSIKLASSKYLLPTISKATLESEES